MRRLHRYTNQNGEVALTLSLIGILVTVIGIGFGLSTARNLQTRNTDAQTGPFPYSSILELRDDAGNVIEWESGMRWSNRYATNNNGDIKDPSQTKARLSWITGSVPANIQNTEAEVTISLPAGYTVVSPFCTSVPITICSNSVLSNGNLTRSKILISLNGSITYGLKVRKVVPPPPPSGKGNVEVQVVALNYPQKTRFWDGNHVASKKPASCSRQGSSGEEQRPLYLSSFKLIATCSGGGCTPGARSEASVGKNKGYGSFLDLPTGQYQLGIKDVSDRGFDVWGDCGSKTYTVSAGQTNQTPVIILQNRIDGEYETESSESNCKADGGQPNLIQGIRGNLCYGAAAPTSAPQPTTPPGGSGLQCNRACIYSQMVGTEKCFEGRCPADRPDCGGNTPKERIDNGNKGCQFAGNVCSAPATEVSCSSGDPIVVPTRAPQPSVVPTTGPSGLSCSRPCIYSDQGKCWKGRCDANNPNCKDGIVNANIGCRNAQAACGVPTTEVDCKNGGPIGPIAVAPKLTVSVDYAGPWDRDEPLKYRFFVSDKAAEPVFLSPETIVTKPFASRSANYTLPNLLGGKEYVIGIAPTIGGVDSQSATYTLIVGCTTRSPDTDDACLLILANGEQKHMVIGITKAGSPPPSVVPPTRTPPTVAPPAPSPTPTANLSVKVNNRIDKLERVMITLEPCPVSGECQRSLEFNGVKDIQLRATFTDVKTSTRHRVRIASIHKQAGLVEVLRGVVNAQENGVVKVDRCPGITEGSVDQDCVIGNVPNEVEFSVHEVGGTPPPPPSPVPPAPVPGGPRVDKFGTCDVFEPGHPCSPENLANYFVGESWENLEKMSAICDRESGGYEKAKNLSCVNGGRDYSVGLFQINLMNPTHLGPACVNMTSANSCTERPDSQACREQFFIPDTNIREAVGKYAGSRSHWGNPFCPWKAKTDNDRCKLANYGDTYGGCWR